jgi:UDP:flavonoid glycosyltransferase YjiC (YdhE family)
MTQQELTNEVSEFLLNQNAKEKAKKIQEEINEVLN